MWLAWVASLVAIFFLGYHWRNLTDRVKHLEAEIKAKIDKPVEEEKKSELIDPLDPVKEAVYQHERMMKGLNPEDE